MVSSLSSVITFHVVFSLTDFKVFVYFVWIYVFRSLCILLNAALCRAHPLKPLFLHTLLWYTYSVALKLKAVSLSLTPHILRFPSSVFFSNLFFIFCHLCHLANSSLFSSFLSGALVDWVQLPDDDGTSAERKSQCDRGRPLHPSRLSA